MKKLVSIDSLAHHLLVGGASLLILILYWLWSFLVPARGLAGTSPLAAIAAISFLPFLINYPHALWSYRLSYGQGSAFIFKNKGILVYLPLAILLVWVSVLFFKNVPVSQVLPLTFVDTAFQKLGIYLNLSLYSSLSTCIFALLLIFQNIFLGQHYAMQTFGVSLFCAQESKYNLSLEQRNLIRYSLNALWFLNLAFGYTIFSVINNSGFEYFAPRFPWIVRAAVASIFFASLIAIGWKVVWVNYKTQKKLPPLDFCCAYLSGLTWIQPLFGTPYDYLIWVAPLGHSLQYLYFCYRVEKNGFSSSAKIKKTSFLKNPIYWVLLLNIAVISYILLQWIPYKIDLIHPNYLFQGAFFLLSFSLLLNLQHYFIDGVVWRQRDSRVRKLLFQTT